MLAGGVFTTVLAGLFLNAVISPIPTQRSLYERIEQGYMTYRESGLAANAREKWFWGSGLQLKSPGAADDMSAALPWERRAAHRAFQYGVRAGLQEAVGGSGFWRGVVQSLPADPEGCAGNADEDACSDINLAFYGLGRWAVLVHFACDVTTSFRLSSQAQQKLPRDFWTRQVDVMAELDQSVQATLPNSRFSRFFSDWRREAEVPTEPRNVLCSREAALLSLGLQ